MAEVTHALYDGTMPNPRLMVESACSWASQDYPHKWMRLVRLCENAMKRGEYRIRRGDLYRMAQEQGMDITACREFRFDNNLWSALSRYLLMFRPGLAAAIHPRDNSPIDQAQIDFADVWHECVNPHTFFFAPTWQQARDAYRLKDVSAL